MTLTPSCRQKSVTLRVALRCRWNCPRHQSTRDWWFVRGSVAAMLILPKPRPTWSGASRPRPAITPPVLRHTRSRGQATTPGKDGLVERIQRGEQTDDGNRRICGINDYGRARAHQPRLRDRKANVAGIALCQDLFSLRGPIGGGWVACP